MSTIKLLLIQAILSQPVYHEDREAPEKMAQVVEVARAIDAATHGAPRPRKEWSALLVAIAWAETGFSLRVHSGACKPLECDRGKARGLWQLHKNLYNAPVWDRMQGYEFTVDQARMASDLLKRSYRKCAAANVDWLTGTINGYAGRRCDDSSWAGLGMRVAAYNRALRAMH